jgi:hypothetical protein
MRTTAIGLLIWLVVMLSERVFSMEGPPITGQKEIPIIVPRTEQLEVEFRQLPPRTWPALYSEDAIKKARKEGYRTGMQDSNQIIISLDAQRQQVLNYNLELLEKVVAARNQLDEVLKSVSPKASHITQLQDILALLNQAIEPPAK